MKKFMPQLIILSSLILTLDLAYAGPEQNHPEKHYKPLDEENHYPDKAEREKHKSLPRFPIQVLQLPWTPANDNIDVRFDTDGVLLPGHPIYVYVRSFPLGVNTHSEELSVINQNPLGTRLLVIVDGQERFYITSKDSRPFTEDQAYFYKRYRKNLPQDIAKNLSSSKHLISVIAVNSYGESIKLPGGAEHKIIDYEKQHSADQALRHQIRQPFLLYNEPSQASYSQKIPILLDFYLQNVALSTFGYRAYLYIDDVLIAILTEWGPYLMQGIPLGQHTLRLTLVDSQNREVPSILGEQKNTFTVTP